MTGTSLRQQFADIALSLLCGLVLLGASRFLFDQFVHALPDSTLMAGSNPMLRLSLARLGLFMLIVAPLCLPLTWPLGRHTNDIAAVLPGAACAAVLYLLLERIEPFHPFPLWLDITRAIVLLLALPLGTLFWWKRNVRHDKAA